jgi:hypothetical protein
LHDFPSSLKALVDCKVQLQLADCLKRLENIEKLEVEIDQVSLKEKMKKLDELDTYTRTKIKNEIATERVNYVALQRTAIEDTLNAKINEKISMNDFKTQFNPIIDKLTNTLFLEFKGFKYMYQASSIISSE